MNERKQKIVSIIGICMIVSGIGVTLFIHNFFYYGLFLSFFGLVLLSFDRNRIPYPIRKMFALMLLFVAIIGIVAGGILTLITLRILINPDICYYLGFACLGLTFGIIFGPLALFLGFISLIAAKRYDKK